MRPALKVWEAEKDVLELLAVDLPIAGERAGQRDVLEEVAGRKPVREIGRRARPAAATGGEQRQEEAAEGRRQKRRFAVVVGELGADLDGLERTHLEPLLEVEVGVFLVVGVGDFVERPEVEDQIVGIGRVDPEKVTCGVLPVRS